MVTFAWLRPYLKGFLGALIAILLASVIWGVYHLWIDHLVFHQLVAAWNDLMARHPELQPHK